MPLLERMDHDLISTSFSTPLSSPKPNTFETGKSGPEEEIKLTDMVGLDVRLHIGEYLARELGNPAFEPPDLMREMVDAGKLGKKAGQGFYDWSRSAS